jgi:hypothetical protein
MCTRSASRCQARASDSSVSRLLRETITRPSPCKSVPDVRLAHDVLILADKALLKLLARRQLCYSLHESAG